MTENDRGAQERLAALLHPSVCENAPGLGMEHLPAYLPEPECEHVARSLLGRGLAVVSVPAEPGAGDPDAQFDAIDKSLLMTFQWSDKQHERYGLASHALLRHLNNVGWTVAPLASQPDPAPEASALREALMDMVSLMPADRYGLLRRTTRDFIDAHTATPQGTATPNPLTAFVDEAAHAMNVRLRDGAARFGALSWRGHYLDTDNLHRLRRAVDHLAAARKNTDDPTEWRKRAADVANQAFMFADPLRNAASRRITGEQDPATPETP